jgi:segregation and condensation protein B
VSDPGAVSATEAELVTAVEAVLFAAGEPVDLADLARAFGTVEVAELETAVAALTRAYEERGSGLVVEQVAGGYRLATRSEAGPWVRRFFRHQHRTRLSQAALETLAIVAYRQPVTGPEIQAIRGVDPTASLKSLLEKKLLRILGRKKVVGNPLLYGTSQTFLEHFGLNRLSDLPTLTEFDDVLASLDAHREAAPPAEGNGADTIELEDGADSEEE